MNSTKEGDIIQFEYYVLNYNCNKKTVEPFNIFQNSYVQEHAEKEVKAYLQNPSNYIHQSMGGEYKLNGFNALVKEIDGIIRWQEWCRREYEISVGDAFTTECDKLEKIDCYYQAHMNIEIITREVLRQYKQQKKLEEYCEKLQK